MLLDSKTTLSSLLSLLTQASAFEKAAKQYVDEMIRVEFASIEKHPSGAHRALALTANLIVSPVHCRH